MSSTIIASGIPLTTSEEKVQDFFSFCGKIKKQETIDKTEKTKIVSVEFESASAVSTALLLSGAELDGAPIKVIEEGLSKQPVITESSKPTPPADAPPAYQATPATTTTTTSAPASAPVKETTPAVLAPAVEEHADIPQEYKPKATIAAEYLSHGYLLGDQFVQKAVEYDQKKGYSSKFKSFLGNLDSKYNVQQKNKNLYATADNKLKLNERFVQSRSTLSSYFNNDKNGVKIHKFYTEVASNAKQVHEEAKRLAEIKKAEKAQVSSIAPTATTAEAAGAVPLSSEKN